MIRRLQTARSAAALSSAAAMSTLQAPDTVPGDTTTTEIIALGGTVAGAVDTTSDEDWYRVELSADTSYAFLLKGGFSSGELGFAVLRLYDSAGMFVTEVDNFSFQSFLAFSPAVSGTYFLSAGTRDVSGELSGSYTLSANVVPVDDIAAGTSSKATLALNRPVKSTIGAAGDSDWFRINLKAGETYKFDLVPDGSGGVPNPTIELRDARGGTITESTSVKTATRSAAACPRRGQRQRKLPSF